MQKKLLLSFLKDCLFKVAFQKRLVFFSLLLFAFSAKAQEENEEDPGYYGKQAYDLLTSDSIPKFSFSLGESLEEDNPDPMRREKKTKEKKKDKGRIFYGMKTKKTIIRPNSELAVNIRYPKFYEEPENIYTQELYYYDKKSLDVKYTTYDRYKEALRKGSNFVLLHGPYKKTLDKEVIEEGYFYLGTKDGKWKTYDKQGVLTEKLKYNKGWLADADIKTYDGERIKEVIPYVYGLKHGMYYAFHENGQLALSGEYEYDYPIGNWREFYANGKRKKLTEYPKNFYIEKEPVVRYEWNPQGAETYRNEK